MYWQSSWGIGWQLALMLLLQLLDESGNVLLHEGELLGGELLLLEARRRVVRLDHAGEQV